MTPAGVSATISLTKSVLSSSGEKDIPGLTDTTVPRRLGPKRASKIRKLFNLAKEDDVRQYVVRRPLNKEGETFFFLKKHFLIRAEMLVDIKFLYSIFGCFLFSPVIPVLYSHNKENPSFNPILLYLYPDRSVNAAISWNLYFFIPILSLFYCFQRFSKSFQCCNHILEYCLDLNSSLIFEVFC